MNQVEFEELKNKYYTYRGWDIATGKPIVRKLIELGLNEVSEELKNKELIN